MTQKASRWGGAAALAVVFAAVSAQAPGAVAEEFPQKPIRLVVAYPPGGSVDNAARLLAATIGGRLGQPVVVENRVGAAGVVGTSAMAASRSDGHSFLIAATAVMAIVPHVRKLSFVPQEDFVPVAQIANTVGIVAARPGIAAMNFDELITEAKRDNKELRYGYVGPGTITHLTGEVIKRDTGVNLLSVPYKGNADQITALIAGEIDFAMDPTAMAQVKSGRLKALAVDASSRIAELPNVPTLAEGKIRIPRVPSWIGIFAQKGTPDATVQRMASEVERALALPEVREKLLINGLAANFAGPAVFGRQVANDSAFFATLIRENKIVLD